MTTFQTTTMFRTMLQRTIGTGLLMLGVTGAGNCLGNPEQQAGAEHRGIIVSTPAVGLPLNEKARVVVLQARPEHGRVPVVIRFKDAHGRLLASRSGVVGPNRPVIKELARASLGARGSVLLQTEVVLRPTDLANRTSCPLHLTVEILPEDDSRGSSFPCSGIDPCLGLVPGPGSSSGVFPICHARPIVAPQPQ